MGQCISAACVLAIMVAGLLVMVRAITIEQLVDGMVRMVVIVLGMLLALCILKSLLVAIILPALISRKPFIVTVTLIGLLILGALVVTNIAAHRVKNKAGKDE